jgi:cytoskeletal protein RodZ
MQTPADRLKKARESVGKEPRQIAQEVGLNVPSYYDLEEHDDEIAMCLSLGELRKVCRAVGLRVPDLLTENAASSPRDEVSLDAVATRLKKHLEQRGIPLSTFEDGIGWSLPGFLEDPQSAVDVWNLECLQAVCSPLQLDWLAVCASIK